MVSRKHEEQSKRSPARAVALIPARLESSRLPEKALRDICGLPMIVHVYRRTAMASSLDDVYVVTDSERIVATTEEHGGKALMTSPAHQTGTDRIAEAVRQIDCEIVVNVQGDEALVRPRDIDASVLVLRSEPNANATILVTPYHREGVTSDIKAVLNEQNNVMYLSRADIPSEARTPDPERLKAYHGIGFRTRFLLRYASWRRGRFEVIEFHEHLRILEKGYRMRAIRVDSDSISVNTLADLDFGRRQMERDSLFE